MAAISFPEAILGRGVLRQGFRYRRADAIERTPMDSGMSRGRLYNTNPLAKVPVVYAWTDFQIAFFEAFMQTVADRGARWFNVWLPLEGNEYRQVLARIVEVPDRTPHAANKMLCPIVFEIRDATILPDGIVELVLLVGATGTQDMAAALDGVTLQPAFEGWATAGFDV